MPKIFDNESKYLPLKFSWHREITMDQPMKTPTERIPANLISDEEESCRGLE